MAAPVVGVNLTNYVLAEGEGNWATIGGGAAAFETDYYIQGTQSYTKRVSNNNRQVYNNTGGITFGTGDHVYVWLYATGRAVVDTVANGGFGVFMSDGGSTNYKVYYTDGSDVSLATGWRCFVADPNATPTATNTIQRICEYRRPTHDIAYLGFLRRRRTAARSERRT